MPFDGVDPLRATVALIDGILAYYGDDESRWCRQRYHNGTGGRCLSAAARYVRKETGIRGDQLGKYLAKIDRRAHGDHFGIPILNDMRCSNLADVRTTLLAAREAALAKMEGRPEQPVDIASITYTPEQHQFSIRQLVEVLVAREVWARH